MSKPPVGLYVAACFFLWYPSAGKEVNVDLVCRLQGNDPATGLVVCIQFFRLSGAPKAVPGGSSLVRRYPDTFHIQG